MISFVEKDHIYIYKVDFAWSEVWIKKLLF